MVETPEQSSEGAQLEARQTGEQGLEIEMSSGEPGEWIKALPVLLEEVR